MNKKQLRREAINLLEDTTDHERSEIEQQLFHHLVTSAAWRKATTIGITISRGLEWHTGPIIEKGWREEKKVCVPKCFPAEKKLQFYEIDDYRQLEAGFYDLMEPQPERTVKIDKKEMDLVIVPGLVFDYHGYRIGFGGGYYDRFLTDFPNHTLSLAASFQMKATIPAEAYDIPVQQIITEKGIWTV